MQLSNEHDAAAQRAGWAVFDASGSSANDRGNWPLQIQRLDELGLLEDDMEAWRIVIDGAGAGSDLHLATVKLLREHSKPELALIYRHRMKLQLEGEAEGEHCQRTHDAELDNLEHMIFGRVVSR